ncbi:MAG: Rieske 2Fe-2S domain-containing protein [Anaerolineales bacterium]
MTDLSRRDFLKLARDGFLAISGALTAVGVWKFLTYESTPARPTRFDLGPAANYPLGSRTPLNEIPALLIHSDEGFTALSLTCTHLGCTVEAEENGFACPCHNSQFDLNGNVKRGPAAKPLQRLRVEATEDGVLIVEVE